MLDELIAEYDPTKSGWLFRIGSNYYPSIGWNFCETGQIATQYVDWRAFFSFDTSEIPDHAQIEWVYFRVRRFIGNDPMGMPETYLIHFSLGSFIGDALNGTAEEWDGGDLMVSLDEKPSDKQTIDLAADGQDPCPLVNKSGETDVRIWDASTQGTGDDSWGTSFNKDADTLCKLFIGFSVPSATVTGKGSASAAAHVIHDAAVTASGTADATSGSTVVHHAGTSATGVGRAAAAGGIDPGPLAVHSGSAGVSHVHSGTITLADSDDATRDGRRQSS